MKITITHRFSPIKADWERLFLLTPEVSPFLHPEAFEISYRYFYPYYLKWFTLPLFAVFSDGYKTRAIVPLLKIKGKFRLFGDVNGFNECGFLYDNVSVLPDVISLLLSRFGDVEFMKIDQRSPISNYKAATAKVSNNVAIQFGNDYDDYFKTLSKSVRQNIRTAYNRLNKDGNILSVKYFGLNRGEQLPVNKLIESYVRRHSERYGVTTSNLKRWFLKYQSFATRCYADASNAFTSVLYINSKIAGFLSGLCNDNQYPDCAKIVNRFGIPTVFSGPVACLRDYKIPST